jgi:hypothetical protein
MPAVARICHVDCGGGSAGNIGHCCGGSTCGGQANQNNVVQCSDTPVVDATVNVRSAELLTLAVR